ncbi:MAG: Gldg family protein [Candidatus Aminicenantes bacterium]|nr:Gldg family protein [Candidatus Aminicenantes bacterium]
MEHKHKKDMSRYYKFALYLVIIILINVVGRTLFFRSDLTANSLYSLSPASKKVVGTLKEPLTINVFFTENLPAPYNNVERYLHDLLKEYELDANKHLSYRFYNVSAQEGDLSTDAEKNRKLAQSYGVYPVNVQRIERDEARMQRAYMGMVLIHGDMVEKLSKIDTTEGLEYRITHAIEKLNKKISAYLNLPQKIKVRLVLSSSISRIAGAIKLQGLDNLRSEVAAIIDKLQSKTYGKLEFTFTDPTTDPQAAAGLQKYDRFAIQWPQGKTPDGRVIEAGTATLALGMEYGDKSLEKSLLNRSMKLTGRGLEEQYSVPAKEELESFIKENIDNMIDINEDLGYLSSHDTRTLTPQLPPQLQAMQKPQEGELKKLNRLLSKEYTIKTVDMAKDEIPESIDTLIIAGAKTNFSDYQLLQIDQFLMKGKSLAIFVDAFREIQPQRQSYQFQQPMYLPLNTGLEKLLDHYGVKVNKSYLMDESCFVRRTREGEMKFYFVPIIKNKYINHDFAFMRNITELLAVKMSPLEIDEEKIKKNELQAKKVFSSTDKSWEMKGKITLIPPMIQPPTDEKERGSRALAYILSGDFPSFFADKEVPEKPGEDEDKEEAGEGKEGENEKETKPLVKESKIKTKKEIITKSRGGKIFLIGTSEMLSDSVLDDEGASPNAIFLLNMFDYLNDKEEIAVMRSKKQRFNPIKDTKPFTRFFVKALNIGGLTLGFILFGIIVYFNRKARKKTIRQMFQK